MIAGRVVVIITIVAEEVIGCKGRACNSRREERHLVAPYPNLRPRQMMLLLGYGTARCLHRTLGQHGITAAESCDA